MVELVKAGRGAVAVLVNALRCFCFEVQTGKHLPGRFYTTKTLAV